MSGIEMGLVLAAVLAALAYLLRPLLRRSRREGCGGGTCRCGSPTPRTGPRALKEDGADPAVPEARAHPAGFTHTEGRRTE